MGLRAIGALADTRGRFLLLASLWLPFECLCLLTPAPAHAEATSATTPCCDFQGCFQNSAASSAFEKTHQCHLCNPCTQTVQKLQSQPLPPGDPTDGFVVNQTCIANDACAGKANLQNPAWLDSVVPAFVNPFIAQNGQWKAVEKTCRDRPPWLPFRNELCQFDMATYHISNDLQNALDDDGCGTAADWKAVGNIISTCILNGLSSYWPVFKQFASFIANAIVQNDRDSVRNKCIAYRTQHKLPIDAN